MPCGTVTQRVKSSSSVTGKELKMTLERADQEDGMDAEAGESPTSEFTSSRPTQIKLRLDEDQMKLIQKMAADRRTTVTSTVKWLVDRGLEVVTYRNLGDLVDDLAFNWARYGERVLALSVEQDLLQALANRKFEEARALAVQLLKYRANETRRQADRIGS
jgi:hypothetical protein